MIASLMMYDRPELVGTNRRYWALIRAQLAERGIYTPEILSNDAEEFSVWEAPDLVLSQTCGMPFRLRLHDQVTLIGTPDFGVPDCPAGFYNSAFIVRADDPRKTLADYRHARFIYNQTISQSGYAAPYAAARAEGFWFETKLQSHGHVKSALAVAEGRADIAAIDAVTWRLINRYDAFAKDLRVLITTPPTPGLPYIAAKDVDAELYFDAISTAIEQLSDDDRAALGIRGFIAIPAEEYLSVANPPSV